MSQIHTRFRGVATTVNFPLYVLDGSALNATPATFATGDVQILKDEGAATNIGTLPTHEGNGVYSVPLTATEMTADRVAITIVDATEPAVWLDTVVLVEAAWSPLDALSLNNLTVGTIGSILAVAHAGTAQAGSATGITLQTTAVATDDFYNGGVVSLIGGTGAGQGNIISDYTGSSKVCVVQNTWVVNPDATTIYVVYPAVRA